MLRSSIIIPVFNKAALTRQCLDTLLADAVLEESEIIVVDDASSDGTARLLTGYGDRIKIVTHSINRGFAISCNGGAAAAKGGFLVFLNNDTIPKKGWLDSLMNYADDHPKAAAVGAKLLFPDDTIQHSGVVILSQNRFPSHVYSGFPADHPAVNKSRRFQIVTAGCVLIRREVFEQAQGFDPAFHNGYEDVDLCLRFGEMGYEVHYCHESVLYHLESRTRSTGLPVQSCNEKLYAERWAEKARPDDFIYYIEDGLLTVHCPPRYPIYIEASPQLAITPPWMNPAHTHQMLYNRAQQVYDLLQENLDLLVRTSEAEHALSQLTATPENDNGLSPAADQDRNGSRSRGNGVAVQKPATPAESCPRPANGTNDGEFGSLRGDPNQAVLKIELESLRAQHAHDQLNLAELRETLSDLHRKLLQRDALLIEAYQRKTGEKNEEDKDRLQTGQLNFYTDQTVGKLLGFLDTLEIAVERLYHTRRWKWANPVMILRRIFSGSDSIRGYWRIDDILAGYKDWRMKCPDLKNLSRPADRTLPENNVRKRTII